MCPRYEGKPSGPGARAYGLAAIAVRCSLLPRRLAGYLAGTRVAGLAAAALWWVLPVGRCLVMIGVGGSLFRRGWAMAGRSFLARVLGLVAAAGLAGVVQVPQLAVAGSARAAGPGLDWPQYLGGAQHSSVSAAAAFTPLNAASVAPVWHWQPPVVSGEPAPVLDASPTVVAGRVYIGAQSGGFYALDESTGTVVWSIQLDTRPNVTCRPLGITATAAVLPDPVTGTLTVYVSGARFL